MKGGDSDDDIDPDFLVDDEAMEIMQRMKQERMDYAEKAQQDKDEFKGVVFGEYDEIPES